MEILLEKDMIVWNELANNFRNWEAEWVAYDLNRELPKPDCIDVLLNKLSEEYNLEKK